MAITGAIIVLVGLSLLSLIISQLHRIIGFIDSSHKTDLHRETVPPPRAAKAEVDILNDPEAAARIFAPLTSSIGDVFQLSQLYDIFRQENVAHPHLTIRTLRDCGYLLKSEQDLFCWKIESH
jgi:hypothetical protein